MGIKISRQLLERIVQEEFALYLKERFELNERGGHSKMTTPEDDTVQTEPQQEVPSPEGAPEEALPSPEGEVPDGEAGSALPVDGADDVSAPELPGEDEGEDAPEDMAEPGSPAEELQGKTVDSVKLEQDSKLIPGAAEVVIKFTDNPDPLRILLTKTGTFKFFYRGLHSDLSRSADLENGGDEPVGFDGGDDEEYPEEDVGGEDLEGEEDFTPMGDEDMPKQDGEDLEAPEDEEEKGFDKFGHKKN
jgi:hypothetical protein